MTTVLHARLYGRFTEIKSNFWKKNFIEQLKSSNLLGNSLCNRDNEDPQSGLEEKDNSSILEDDFSSRVDPYIFPPITPEL